MYHQSVTMLRGPLRSCCLFLLLFSVRVDFTAHEKQTVYRTERVILGDMVFKCASRVLTETLCVYVIVGMCTFYYLCNRKTHKRGEACHTPCPCHNATKEKGKESVEGVDGRTREVCVGWRGWGQYGRWDSLKGTVSVLSPTGPELGSWQGSHYMHASDSSLSHYASRQLTPPLSHPIFVMQSKSSPTAHTLIVMAAALIYCTLKEKLIKSAALHVSSATFELSWDTSRPADVCALLKSDNETWSGNTILFVRVCAGFHIIDSFHIWIHKYLIWQYNEHCNGLSFVASQ